MKGRSFSNPKVFIETYGCQMNAYDTTAIYGLMASAGYERADALEEAKIILLNTCSVRDHAEHRIMSRVGELRRRQRSGEDFRVLGICGCMAERIGDGLLDARKGFDIAVGVDAYENLPSLVTRYLGGEDPHALTGHDASVHYVAPPELMPANNSHLVTIHKGCDYKCTYCIVPYTRGPQVEKAPDIIVDEIQRIIDGGGVEVTLLGQNVTAYNWRGDGTPLDFSGLLRLVSGIDRLRRIRFLTGHPCDLNESLLQIMADEKKICPFLHVPMQSGSDRVLRRMKRLYRRDDYFAMVDRGRELVPDVTFSGDFMVGFPGETEEDFEDTLEAVRRVRYDQLFLFKYSERPGVPAVKFGDDVSDEIKKRRLAELMTLQDDIWNETAREFTGQKWRVVLEAPARRQTGWWRGRTANNRKVVVEVALASAGEEVEVEILSCRNTTFKGRLVAGTR